MKKFFEKRFRVLLTTIIIAILMCTPLPVLADDTFFSMPESELQKLYVGDSLGGFESFEILSGPKDFLVNTEYAGVVVKKAGEATVKFRKKTWDSDISERTVKLKATNGPAVKVSPVTSLKLGELICNKPRWSNIRYGSLLKAKADYSQLKFLFQMPMAGGGDGVWQRNPDPIKNPTSVLGYNNSGDFYSAVKAAQVGSIDISYYYRDSLTNKDVFITKATCKIEPPVITSNAPSSIKVGSQLDFKTQLTNTAFKSMSIEEAKKSNKDGYEDFYGGEGLLPFIYQANVQIIQGADCVKSTNKDYNKTLCSSERLTFTKKGTVKLKVKYKNINDGEEYAYGMFKNPYVAEKIITINVTDGTEWPSKPGAVPGVNSSDSDRNNSSALQSNANNVSSSMVMTDVNGEPIEGTNSGDTSANFESDSEYVSDSSKELFSKESLPLSKEKIVVGVCVACAVVAAVSVGVVFYRRRKLK